MAQRKKAPEVRVHIEPIPEDRLFDLICRIAFGMNAEQAAKAIRQNANGKYDELYRKEYGHECNTQVPHKKVLDTN